MSSTTFIGLVTLRQMIAHEFGPWVPLHSHYHPLAVYCHATSAAHQIFSVPLAIRVSCSFGVSQEAENKTKMEQAAARYTASAFARMHEILIHVDNCLICHFLECAEV